MDEIRKVKKYLEWLEDAVSSTSVVEDCKLEDYSIQKVGENYKLINLYDEQKKKEYEEKHSQNKPIYKQET